MAIRESHHGYWSSSAGFVWVAAGAVIGIGNVSRLPYLAAEYGGSAFLMVYGLVLLLVGWPLLSAELLAGRYGRQDLVRGVRRLVAEANASPAWHAIGWLGLAGALIILSYSSVLAGWSLAYSVRAAAGAVGGMDAEAARTMFLAVAQDPERSLAWHTLFMVLACVVVAHGLRDGLERAGRYLMTGASALLLGLVVYAKLHGDFAAAIALLWTPDFARLGWAGAMEALHQAFFTLSLGVGAMYVYGAYLPASARVSRLAAGVIVLDTLFALVAGTAVYALLLAAGQPPLPGLAMIFQAFPGALAPGLDGVLPGTLFYLLLVMVTLASAAALMEPVTLFLMERMRTTRVFAATAAALVAWFIGLGTVLSFSEWRDLALWDRNFFEWAQWLTARLLAPASALLICVFVARIMPRPLQLAAWGQGEGLGFRLWRGTLTYPTRIAMIVLFLYCLGALDMLFALWR